MQSRVSFDCQKVVNHDPKSPARNTVEPARIFS
jgi:hypothetical protein